MTTQENNNGNEAINSQYYQQPHLIFVDNINDMLRISDINEMDSKIAKNTINITKIFQYFQNNVYDGSSITKEDINKLIHCLKFVDTLNLFMTNQATSTLLRYMEEIYDLFNVLSNTESKDLILKQIKYTEMTVIYYKKKTFKQLYFGDSKLLAKEIEYNLELVNKNGKFDQKLFKQMQNLFYVVQGKIEETKRNEIQTKMNELKTISIKIKKRRFNSPNQGNYYDDYNDYSDYKNYSNISGKTYDYNDNFYDNDNYYEDNDYYYQDRYFYSRHPYRGGHHRKYFENEEKEVEVPSPTQTEETNKDNIEVIQTVNTDTNNNNENNNDYNSIYKKKKNIKQRGITLVEVTLPENVNEEHQAQEQTNDTNVEDDTEVITTVVRKGDKYNRYHNNSGYKGNNYGKGQYYNNSYNNGYYHSNSRENYYHNQNSGNITNEQNGYYNKRGSQKKNYNASGTKPKLDFVEIDDIKPMASLANIEVNKEEPQGESKEEVIKDSNSDKINDIDFQQTFVPSPTPEEDNSEFKGALSDNVIHGDYEEEEESSESVDNDELNAQFKEFIKETFHTDGKDYEGEDYYQKETDKNDKVVFEDDDENNNDSDNDEDIESKILKGQELLNYIPSTKEEDTNGVVDINAIDNNEEVKQSNQIESQEKKEEPVHNINEDVITGNKYKDSVKNIDPQIISTIKHKLSEDYNNQENKQNNQMKQNYINYQNNIQMQNNQINPAFLINLYQRQLMMNCKPNPLQYINNAMLTRGRDANLHREYFTLKTQDTEGNPIIKNNIANFESKILIPLYQRITFNVNKKRGIYLFTFMRYKKLIHHVLLKDKIIKKVKPYGSYMNNFLIDSGDIDICIVPRCSIIEFSSYLEKIKDEITSKKLGEKKLIHHTERYLLLKVIDYQTKFTVDITVHNMLPIQNTNLIRLYSLYDQRFHILGLYIKHWAKINKIHGAADNFLSSYALLLMLIHFLQKIPEQKVLPNLQKIEPSIELNYDYSHNGKTVSTNLYYEEDINKINDYMNRINNGKYNKETAANLLIQFFEYYAYCFNSNEQRISIKRDLPECMKKHNDNIAFSIEDPFDVNHNPGKSMGINSQTYNKFITAMKKEINFILNGEYVKRIDKIISGGNNGNTNTVINQKSN